MNLFKLTLSVILFFSIAPNLKTLHEELIPLKADHLVIRNVILNGWALFLSANQYFVSNVRILFSSLQKSSAMMINCKFDHEVQNII
jgi:hypothetical protein